MISDLLDLARYGESGPHRENVRLDLLAGHVVRRLRQHRPTVRVETTLHPCLVQVDPDGVDRALANLLDNAVKWSPPGGTVCVLVDKGRVCVSDQGPGVSEHEVPHIFERFYRSTAAQGMPGSGLGLAIVGQVASANGGTVSVKTGPTGSAFTLQFPPLTHGGADGEQDPQEAIDDRT